MTKQKREFRAALKRAKAGSAISWPRILATALAAVTMTLLSTRLTSIFGSLMLVAVISIGSALVAEFYRIVISITAEGTKKVIAPIVPENPLGLLGLEVEPEATAEPVEEPETKPRADSSKGWKTNQYVQLALIFGVVSLITVGISYAVASAQGGDVYNNVFETNRIEKLDESEKQALVELAVQTAHQGMPDFKLMETQLQTLTSQNAALAATINELQQAATQDGDLIAQLQSQIVELQQRVDELQQPAITPDTTDQPG